MTRLRVARHRSLFVGVLLLSVWAFVAPLSAQLRIKVPAAAPEVETVLSQGRQLETQNRWSEAVSLYEEATHKNPDQIELEQRLDVAKLHYDVGRRYADSTFRKSLLTLSESEALDLYGQVMTRLATHYVDQPDWKRLVDRGTQGLSFALAEPPFTDTNLPDADADRVAIFRQQLQQLAASRPIRDRNAASQLVGEVARLAQRQLGLRPAAVIFEYVSAAVGGLDDYSTFLTAGQLADLYSQIDGNFVGLGVELKAQNGALLILNVIPGSPAEKAGIRQGDRLTQVAGQSTEKLSTDQAAELLQGEVGTSVELIAVSENEAPRTVVVRRNHVEVPSIEDARLLDAELGVAYFKLTCFQKTTTADLDAALWKLYRQGMKSLIIDLRGNPGGLLTSSVEVADKFIEQGSIVSTRGRSPNEDFNYTAQRSGTWRVPLVVLIDGDSASASEIFAGAIRDHHRGTVVGTRSYGKGSVQGIFPLSIGGAGLRLTTAKFYSPNGRAYHRVGVAPDVVVASTEQSVTALRPVISLGNDQTPTEPPPMAKDKKSDAVLEAGIQVARQQLTRTK